MKNTIAFAVYLNRQNKNSFAAVIGALEVNPALPDLPVYFFKDETELNEKIEELSFKYQKIILAFSFASFQVKEISILVGKIKKKFKDDLILLAGGPHSSGDPVGTLAMGFDLVVIGEGEETTAELLQFVLEGKDISTVKGLALIKNKKFYYTGKRKDVDLNDYPPFAPIHKIFGPIEITRGCPWGCQYCQTSYLFGRKVRHRSIEQISKYVKILKENKRNDIRFITPNALSYDSRDGKEVNLEAIENLLGSVRKIIGKDGRIFFGSFPSEVRPEQVTAEALNIIKKYCDNDNLIIGAQSGSQRILNSIGRCHKVEDVHRATALAIEKGFKVNVDFIFGLPGETSEDREVTFKAMEDLVRIGARIHGHTFMPLPGTPLSKAKFGSLSGSENKRLKKLEAQGALYGEWEKQAKTRSL